MPEKNKNSWSPWSQSGRWKGRRTMEETICYLWWHITLWHSTS